MDLVVEPLLERERECASGYFFYLYPWRATVAPALAAIGRADEGRELAQEELRSARRRGAARPLGAALRALAHRCGATALAERTHQELLLIRGPARWFEYQEAFPMRTGARSRTVRI